MRRPGRLLLAGALALGCATAPPLQLNRTALRRTRPGSISGVVARAPRFRVDAAGVGLIFGPLAVAVEDGIDEARLKPVGLRDPAQAITEQLLDDMAKHFALRILDADDVDEGAHPSLVLRVETTRWGVANGLQSGVGILYEARLTLRDARSNAVLVEGLCVVHPVDGDSLEVLARGGRARLQEEVEGVTDYCLDDYRHRVLGL